MPELPEVETIRAQLAPLLTGRRVTTSWGFDSPKFAGAAQATGASMGPLRRRGKYLLADLDDPNRPARELVLHLGMTGRLAVLRAADRPVGCLPRHLRARWDLDDDTYLGFWDQRRFGRAIVVPRGDHSALPTLSRLGPEPFSADFTPDGLRRGLSGRKAIKTSLMDQRLVAGVGNIYADEALWQAGIRPTTRRLGPRRAVLLHRAVLDVLGHAIGDGGTTLRDYRDASGSEGSHQSRLRCYGRAGQPCERCSEPLAHGVVDGRGTTWCRRCQR